MILNIRRSLMLAAGGLSALALSACATTPPATYAASDFAAIRKIDAHVHVNVADDAFVDQARADNFEVLSINVDYPAFPSLADQAGKLINPSPAFFNAPSLELASLLTQNSCFDHVFFASSGAEANEGAIKLARKWGQRHKAGAFEIITLVNGFHGRTLATMSASGKAGCPSVDRLR